MLQNAIKMYETTKNIEEALNVLNPYAPNGRKEIQRFLRDICGAYRIKFYNDMAATTAVIAFTIAENGDDEILVDYNFG